MLRANEGRTLAQLALSELKFAPRSIFPVGRSIRPFFPEFDTERAIDEKWKGSTWVYVCSMLNAQALASMPWRAMRRTRGRLVPAPETTLQRLLDRPNPFWSQRDLIMRIGLELQIAGNSVVCKVRAQPSQPPVNLFTARPQLVVPIPSRDIHNAGFSVHALDGRRYFLGAQNACHIQLPDPGNPYWGMSPLEAASRPIDADRKAGDWQSMALDNGLVPPGAFIVPKHLSDAEFDKAIVDIGEQYTGALNAGRPLVLSEVQFVQLATSPRDMDHIEGRKLTREEICAAHHVPPPVAGILERATYSNIQTAREIWYEDGVLPLAGIVSDTLTTTLAREFGDDLEIHPDTSKVPALVAQRQARIAGVKDLWAMGAPFNIAAEFMGLDLEIPGGDIGYVPNSLVPSTPEGAVDLVDMLGMGSEPAEPEPSDVELVEQARARYRATLDRVRAEPAEQRSARVLEFRRWIESRGAEFAA